MKGLSITGLVLGIVALVLGWFSILSLVALPMAIVGLVLSVKGGKKAVAATGAKYGVATAGVVIGIIAVILNAILFLTCGLCGLCAMCALDAAGDAASSLI